jgi:hypothetical protein
LPFCFETSMAASPARVILRFARRRSTRSLLTRDQRLFGFRGVTSRRERSVSTVFRTLSIHPKQSASSTMASYGTDGPVAPFL